MNVKLNFNTLSFFLSYVSIYVLLLCNAVDAETITSARIIRDGELVRSENGSFILGFFSPGNSTNRYLGIWFGTFEIQTAVWVANREVPLKDSSGLFKISDDGNLVAVDGNGVIHWSSNATFASNNTVYELLNNGNLVIRNGDASSSNYILWQSFDHPSDTFLAEMKFGLNLKTGENQLLTGWKSDNDPAPGNFTLGFDPRGVAQIVIWKNSRRHWRSGLWNGQRFSGLPEMTSYFLYGFNIVTDSDQGRLYSIYSELNKTLLSRFVLSPYGKLERSYMNREAQSWDIVWSQPISDCQFYETCGPNGICNQKKSPICSCLTGFMPKSPQDWNSGNWSGGCVRKKPLECKGGSMKGGYLKLQNVKLPDYSQSVVSAQSDIDCKTICQENCSCIGYTYDSGTGCLTWQEGLIDIQLFSTGGDDFYLRLPKSELTGMKKWKWILFFLVTTSGAVLLLVSVCFIWKRIRRTKGSVKENNQDVQRFWELETPRNSNQNFLDKLDGKEFDAVVSPRKGPDLPLYVLDAVRIATNDFSLANKLGEGGFGPVFKGKLPGGQEIAVKRLSKGSGQGLQEFENEVILIAKLQHRNLVRLLGCCIQGDERLLIYEYMPNKSLDAFLFDPSRSALLNWKKRFDIIEGIARGLLYLHRDSRLRIIHRDLKASNILLDEEMNPKISDFGMARIFGGQQNQENTMRVVGTYGYMSPEYAMEGFFSVKSDVFSFGVVLLEIVSGKRNAGFCLPDQHVNLLGHAWELWKEDKVLELLDSCLKDSYTENEVRRCIEVGLLCVQDSASDRPTMDHVVFMLSSETAVFDAPQKPTFSLGRSVRESDAISSERCSNVVTLSKILGR